ncbi:MAG TPA: polyphosphate kinase 1 [Candidatus Acidoferrales bacterium]|nr:polyphosphate kinase 1 [Candidatus Acidoferrales bacterium]
MAASARKPAPEPRARKHSLPAPDLDNPSLYVNRELGLLSFQWRVLEEALDPTNPLLERVNFLAIVGSNVNEFFMVRVASLTAQVDAGIPEFGPDRMSPSAQLLAIRRETKRLIDAANNCLENDLRPALAEEGIRILSYSELSSKQLQACKRYFSEIIFPVLTPLAFDPGRPFPHISNLSLNLAVLIRDSKGNERFARLKVPDSLPALVPLTRPRKAPGKRARSKRVESYVWIEEVIAANLDALFPGMQIVEAHPFHVTRDADIAIKELEAEDLLETIEEGVRQRKFGSVVRLQVNQQMPQHILQILLANLLVEPNGVYRIKGLLGLSRLSTVAQIDRPDLRYKPFLPSTPPELKPLTEDEDLFSIIRSRDVLLHHPFQSFQPVVDFLHKAARDPDVLTIKIVLYRVGRNSPVVEALLEAIEEGKQVAVLMELKARFDEESNIEWAKTLERAGCHVVYGLLGLKIHCKAALVLRKEGDVIRPYVHLATGNYNVVTAHLYTDLGLFTCNPELASDTIDLFNFLTGYSAKRDYQTILLAPINLRQRLESMIRREIQQHEKSGKGHLVFKMNALVDPEMIALLYRASQAGIRIDLLVRGVCCLRPGVPGVSENIRVTSIVGRFLEHSRIYYFHNGGKEEIYLGSADLMPRNLNRRVEVLFPVDDPDFREQIRDEILTDYLRDNVKARRMLPDGTYKRVARAEGQPHWNSQEVLLGNVPKGRKKLKLSW